MKQSVLCGDHKIIKYSVAGSAYEEINLPALFLKKQMNTPKPSPMAIITRCLTLTRMTLSRPKASPHCPPLQPISRQQRLLSTPLLICAARCIWPAVPAAACPTGRPGAGWWEQTPGTSCITDTTMALETLRRSWATTAASTTAAASRLSTDTSRPWPAPSTSTTAHKDRGLAFRARQGRVTLPCFLLTHFKEHSDTLGKNDLMPPAESLLQTSRTCLT